jgi:cytochrome c556
MQKLRAGIAIAALATLAGTAFAQQQPPTPQQAAEKAAHARHAMFETIGTAFGPAAAALRNKAAYDAGKTSLAATRIEILAGMIKEVTVTDTSKLVTTTEAKPEIWANRADFESKADNLVKAAQALKVAASSTDVDAGIKATQGLAAACKSCHDTYRKQK